MLFRAVGAAGLFLWLLVLLLLPKLSLALGTWWCPFDRLPRRDAPALVLALPAPDVGYSGRTGDALPPRDDAIGWRAAVTITIERHRVPVALPQTALTRLRRDRAVTAHLRTPPLTEDRRAIPLFSSLPLPPRAVLAEDLDLARKVRGDDDVAISVLGPRQVARALLGLLELRRRASNAPREARRAGSRSRRALAFRALGTAHERDGRWVAQIEDWVFAPA